MNASLDTDVVIHLYQSRKKELLSMFDSRYIHEYLVEEELKKVSRLTYDELKADAAHSQCFTNALAIFPHKNQRGVLKLPGLTPFKVHF